MLAVLLDAMMVDEKVVPLVVWKVVVRVGTRVLLLADC